ncbi:hypothetical protein KOI35_25125 [Actinoplanes bogorensis]|uniref:Uncharacterized protein n=1 Tax=Paractinoplanes bogorensis TaxID=1610840 RepID=A0ABS5YTL4_9ACTN|nr:hypothetical protein [Actinoplanes bogorensis]MBU2666797.1 hypothetical protein [Actinoplanes bogorensis]
MASVELVPAGRHREHPPPQTTATPATGQPPQAGVERAYGAALQAIKNMDLDGDLEQDLARDLGRKLTQKHGDAELARLRNKWGQQPS